MRDGHQRWPWVVVVLAALALLAGCPDKKPKDPACDKDTDCQAGYHCINKRCMECGQDSHCPAGETCQQGACVKNECTTDDQCPAGETCQQGQCRACENDGECGPGGKCNAGACERPKACKVDEDCADDEDCIEGRCQQPWRGDKPDGLDCELTTIYFDLDQSVIREEARSTLNGIAECIQKAPADRAVSIYGHTDDSGTEEYNIALSERRAQAVADYLARLGIDPARFHVIAKGEGEPSGRGAEGDRRVEFEWR